MKKEIKHDKAEKRLKITRLNDAEFTAEAKGNQKTYKKDKIISSHKKVHKDNSYKGLSFSDLLKPE